MPLQPWYKVVVPREDLRDGRPLGASEFAVHLDKVRDGTAPEDYKNPKRFFDRTYLTTNLLVQRYDQRRSINLLHQNVVDDELLASLFLVRPWPPNAFERIANNNQKLAPLLGSELIQGLHDLCVDRLELGLFQKHDKRAAVRDIPLPEKVSVRRDH
jgi:hypothetical protein